MHRQIEDSEMLSYKHARWLRTASSSWNVSEPWAVRSYGWIRVMCEKSAKSPIIGVSLVTCLSALDAFVPVSLVLNGLLFLAISLVDVRDPASAIRARRDSAPGAPRLHNSCWHVNLGTMPGIAEVPPISASMFLNSQAHQHDDSIMTILRIWHETHCRICIWSTMRKSYVN